MLRWIRDRYDRLCKTVEEAADRQEARNNEMRREIARIESEKITRADTPAPLHRDADEKGSGSATLR